MKLSVEQLMQGINLDRLTVLPHRYGDTIHATAAGSLKFCNWLQYGTRAIQHTEKLGLDNASPSRVLDLGCGFPYFIHACRTHGHAATGVDIDQPLYREVADIFGEPIVWHTITHGVPLPETLRNYDVITMFGFGLPHNMPTDDPWTHYVQMLEDIFSRLNPGGVFSKLVNYGRPWLLEQAKWEELIDGRGSVDIEANLVTVRFD